MKQRKRLEQVLDPLEVVMMTGQIGVIVSFQQIDTVAADQAVEVAPLA